jgi:hypothetical protein
MNRRTLVGAVGMRRANERMPPRVLGDKHDAKRAVNQDEEKSSEVAILGQVGASCRIMGLARTSRASWVTAPGHGRRAQAARGLTSLSIRRRKVRSATSKS